MASLKFIFLTKFAQEVYFDITNWSATQKFEKFSDFSRYPDFFRKNSILGDSGTQYPIGTHTIELNLYMVTKYHLLVSLCKKGFTFSFFMHKVFTLNYDFNLNHTIIKNSLLRVRKFTKHDLGTRLTRWRIFQRLATKVTPMNSKPIPYYITKNWYSSG